MHIFYCIAFQNAQSRLAGYFRYVYANDTDLFYVFERYVIQK